MISYNFISILVCMIMNCRLSKVTTKQSMRMCTELLYILARAGYICLPHPLIVTYHCRTVSAA